MGFGKSKKADLNIGGLEGMEWTKERDEGEVGGCVEGVKKMRLIDYEV